MQNEQLFLQDQIATLRKRLNSLPPPEKPVEKIASAKLQKAFELKTKTLSNIRAQLVDIIGREDAQEMLEEAERDAEVWWSMTHGGSEL